MLTSHKALVTIVDKRAILGNPCYNVLSNYVNVGARVSGNLFSFNVLVVRYQHIELIDMATEADRHQEIDMGAL